MEKIGEGAEKEVYLHPDIPEKVISRFNEEHFERESELSIKGRYYLAKILHLLTPTNIPDTNLAAKGENVVIISERKKLDDEHLEHNRVKMLLRGKMPAEQKNDLLRKETELLDDRAEKLFYDERFISFEKKMREVGVRFDDYPTNFGNDENNNLVYIDNSFKPWYELSGRLRRNYSVSGIRTAIGGLSADKQSHALNYLQRLEEFYAFSKKEFYERGSKSASQK